MFIRQAIVKKVLIRTCRVDFFQKIIRFAALLLGRVEYTLKIRRINIKYVQTLRAINHRSRLVAEVTQLWT